MTRGDVLACAAVSSLVLAHGLGPPWPPHPTGHQTLPLMWLQVNGAQREVLALFPQGEPQLSLAETQTSQTHCKECTNALRFLKKKKGGKKVN